MGKFNEKGLETIEDVYEFVTSGEGREPSNGPMKTAYLIRLAHPDIRERAEGKPAEEPKPKKKKSRAKKVVEAIKGGE